MIRTTIDKSHLQRTIKPLYGWTQATPKSCYLDPTFDRTVAIWPGMVMQRSGGDNVTIFTDIGDHPYGLSALYVGGDGIDEPREAGINAFSVWVLGPDAEFQISAPAFDSSLGTWTDPTDGTSLLVHAYNSVAGVSLQGKLCPAGTANASTRPVARLLKVISSTQIVIGGLVGTTA